MMEAMMDSTQKLLAYLQNKNFLDLIRYLRCSKQGLTPLELQSIYKQEYGTIEKLLQKLNKDNFIKSTTINKKETWSLSLTPAQLEQLDQSILNYEIQFNSERAKNETIDAIGRIQWIDDIAEMIQYAKNNNKSLLS